MWLDGCRLGREPNGHKHRHQVPSYQRLCVTEIMLLSYIPTEDQDADI